MSFPHKLNPISCRAHSDCPGYFMSRPSWKAIAAHDSFCGAHLVCTQGEAMPNVILPVGPGGGGTSHFGYPVQLPFPAVQSLLILDGHGSHITFEFINHCKNDIVAHYCPPPHSFSHLMSVFPVPFNITTPKQSINVRTRIK